MFHQVEGLVIDRGIHLGHLKWTLETVIKAYFEVEDVVLRFRPSYFPFTEPSAEVDVACSWEGGVLKIGGAKACTEILGSGSVYRRGIDSCGSDPDDWQDSAVGVGIYRSTLREYRSEEGHFGKAGDVT